MAGALLRGGYPCSAAPGISIEGKELVLRNESVETSLSCKVLGPSWTELDTVEQRPPYSSDGRAFSNGFGT
jgi:hypothetical protein